ncbi:MAG: prolipoprotein diacylglyceryl transferase, partial [Clostridia bacterium]
GAVFYGGLIGGLAVGFAYLKITKKNSFDYFVIVTPLIPLFHAFGRLGCFFGGCCYGIESNFGFIFTNSLIESANGVRRFPVQLLEMAVLLVHFAVFFIMYKKKFLKKILLPLYLISYGVCRFFIEFLRGDEYRGFVFNMSTSQFISVLIVAICLVAIAIKCYHFKQKRVIEK